MVSADIPARQRQRIVEVDGQLLYAARVVVIWNLTLLCQFYLLEVDAIERGQHLFELVQSCIERH